MKETEQQKDNVKVYLLGASFTTGNMGVSALADSSIKLILNRWPDAKIALIGSGYEPQEHSLFLMGKQVRIRTLPIRFSKNIFLPCHFLRLVFLGLLAKLLPGSRLKSAVINRNPHFKMLYEMEFVIDITGGDSFSDIYGFRRFFLQFLCKWLALFLRKELILLPQTYGPFKGRLSKRMARYIMSRASVVYSRDRAGVEYARKLLNIHAENGKVRFAPDVAFVLDPREPRNIDAGSLNDVRKENSVVVGFNISGLLFNGGYTQKNMFGLKTDYRKLIYSVVDSLMEHKELLILLIPHVFPPKGSGLEVESDPEACRQVYERMHSKYPDRIFLLQGAYNQNEIKYVIGKCGFFIGSRMHSCIAALSQSVTAVGLAYSKKFKGVFESIDVEKFVIDLRNAETEEILSVIAEAFEQRQETASRLRDIIPRIQQQLLRVFDDIP